jgi:hypothetical protein
VSRIPAAAARRIDRLARAAHRFHRFAHHPLCAPYAGEVLRVGRRTRLCRGCALAAAGAGIGAAAALAAPLPSPGLCGLGLVLAAPVAWLAVWPPRAAVPLPAGGPAARAGSSRLLHARRPKLLTRAAPLALVTALAVWGLRTGGLLGAAFAAASAGLTVLAVALYRRRGPSRSPCVTCPERSGPEVCSGFRAIARREAAFARLSGRLLAALPPPVAPSRETGRLAG